MKVVKGNNTIELNKDDFDRLSSGFSSIKLDLGTGDGRFVYERAQGEPDTFFVGVDPIAKQLEVYSKKAVRKKLRNVLFVVGSLDHFPPELYNKVDKVFIIFPWGELLQAVVSSNSKLIDLLKKIMKPKREVEIILGYHPEAEPTETLRLNLPELDDSTLRELVAPGFEENGFASEKIELVRSEEMAMLPSTWGKKLAHGQDRPIYKMILLS